MGIVDFLWIVPSTGCLSRYYTFEKLKDDFTFLDLSQNFRNSREIVKTTKSVAENGNYDYKKGIVMPPDNFPTGCTPIFADSLEEAMKEARKLTKDGILIITDNKRKDFDIFSEIREIWKAYHDKRKDFQEWENPYKFLQDGNVLVIDNSRSLGFDWTTVIVFEQIKRDKTMTTATWDDCNYMLRCTTNLVLKKNKETRCSIQ